MGTLSDRLDAEQDVSVRRRLRAEAHAALPSFAGRSWSRGQYTVTVLAGPALVSLNGVPTVRLRLRFVKSGVDVTPPDFNPWFIQSPPILVPDLAGEVIRTGTDRDGVVVSRRYREDPAAALAVIVKDKIREVFGA